MLCTVFLLGGLFVVVGQEARRLGSRLWVNGPRALYLMHIPKCAGDSAAIDMPKLLPEYIGFFEAEFCWEYVHCMDPGSTKTEGQVITFLRWPRAHLLSQYHQCTENPWSKAQVRKWAQEPGRTAEQIEAKDFAMASFGNWLEYFATTKPLNKASDFQCYHPFNMQTRAFNCPCGDARNVWFMKYAQPLDVALSRLNQTWVGLLEYYQESVCMFLIKAAQTVPSFCHCDKPEWFQKKWTRNTHKTSSHKLNADDLSEHELQLMDSLTHDDFVLYWAGAARFEEEIQEIERKYAVKILCRPGPMEKLNSHVQAAAAIRAPPLPPAAGRLDHATKRPWRIAAAPLLARQSAQCEGAGAYPCSESCTFVTLEDEVQCGVKMWGCYSCSGLTPHCPACSTSKRSKITECEGAGAYPCATGCVFVTAEQEASCGVKSWGCYKCSFLASSCAACSTPQLVKLVAGCNAAGVYPCAQDCAFVTVEQQPMCGVASWGCYNCSTVESRCPACSGSANIGALTSLFLQRASAHQVLSSNLASSAAVALLGGLAICCVGLQRQSLQRCLRISWSESRKK